MIWEGLADSEGPQQQMAVLGHKNVANDAEAEFDAQVGEGGDKLTLEPVRIEHASAPIGAGGDEVKMIGVVETPQPSHQEIVAQRREASCVADIKKRCLRHPVATPVRERRTNGIHHCLVDPEPQWA